MEQQGTSLNLGNFTLPRAQIEMKSMTYYCILFCVCFVAVVCFWDRRSLPSSSWSWNSLFKTDWPQTQRYICISLQSVGIKACATTPSPKDIFVSYIPEIISSMASGRRWVIGIYKKETEEREKEESILTIHCDFQCEKKRRHYTVAWGFTRRIWEVLMRVNQNFWKCWLCL